MNAETKLALALMALLAVGLWLIAWGSGVMSSKLGAMITGGAVGYVATALLVAMVGRR